MIKDNNMNIESSLSISRTYSIFDEPIMIDGKVIEGYKPPGPEELIEVDLNPTQPKSLGQPKNS